MKTTIKTLLFAVFMLMFAQCSVQTPTDSNVKTLIVSSEQRDCDAGAGTMKCMLVKENEDNDWENFYNNINGFTYEPGYEYVLQVSTQKVDNPAADTSSLRYTLVKQISKTKK